jgi:hypothetical protein
LRVADYAKPASFFWWDTIGAGKGLAIFLKDGMVKA